MTDPVVLDLDVEIVVETQRDRAVLRVAVAGSVGDRLADDAVGGELDRGGERRELGG